MEEIMLKGYFISSCIYNLFRVPRVKCQLCSVIKKRLSGLSSRGRLQMYLHTATFLKSLFDSFFHSLLRSRTIADGAAAGVIVFITEASAFCFFKPEHRGIMQAVCEIKKTKKTVVFPVHTTFTYHLTPLLVLCVVLILNIIVWVFILLSCVAHT